MKSIPFMLIIGALIAFAASAADLFNQTPEEPKEIVSVSKIYWSDGDSGRLDGKSFRLANVDAPEKGGVGAIGGAKCEAERELAFETKEYIVELTRTADVEISKSYGEDKYGREVVDLSVNGRDLAELGLSNGRYKPWPHKGQRALTRKPDWCGMLLASND